MSPDPESDALTTRPVRPPLSLLVSVSIILKLASLALCVILDRKPDYIYTPRQTLSIIAFKMEAEMAGKNESQCFKILTLSFLIDVMVTNETIRICSGLKSAVIKILNDES